MENDMAIQKIKLKIGTVYQKEPNGIYYFRYQVNKERKCVSSMAISEVIWRMLIR